MAVDIIKLFLVCISALAALGIAFQKVEAKSWGGEGESGAQAVSCQLVDTIEIRERQRDVVVYANYLVSLVLF